MRYLILVLLMSVGLRSVHAADLPRSTPEEQGVSSKVMLAFLEAADKNIDGLHSFMMVRHGHVVTEGWWAPYNAAERHQLYSLSKSFTSTAVGLAIAEGKLKLDDELVKLFPEDVPANATANLKAMRISDLLRMTTGQLSEPARKPDEPWTKTFLSHTVPAKPGTFFLYNTSATYMLSAAVQKTTGKTLLDYLTPRLFEPLGIDKPTWETSPQGISTGGYGLSVRTEDIAKFGQLYLQKGHWNGKQLVPSAWVEEATARQTSNGSNPKSDWDQGYGYQFWRSRHGAYRGDGAFGQYCIVLPEQDTVIAITSGVKDMQAVLNLVWDKLLPELNSKALPADKTNNTKLLKTLKSLTLKHPESKGTPGKVFGKKFSFPANDRKLESITLEAGEKDAVTIVARVDGKERRIACGNGTWLKGRAAWGLVTKEQPVAVSGAWTTDDTFTAKLCFTETPFVLTLRLKITGNELRYEAESNVGFGATKEPALTGKAD